MVEVYGGGVWWRCMVEVYDGGAWWRCMVRVEATNVYFTKQIEAKPPKTLNNIWFLKNFGGGKQKTLILLSKTAENHQKP